MSLHRSAPRRRGSRLSPSGAVANDETVRFYGPSGQILSGIDYSVAVELRGSDTVCGYTINSYAIDLAVKSRIRVDYVRARLNQSYVKSVGAQIRAPTGPQDQQSTSHSSL